MTADYDSLAWFYERYWRTRYHDAARPALARLLYQRLEPHSFVVDLCCGTGHLSRELVARGYHVVGIDRSLQMLKIASDRVPQASFVCADARSFALGPAAAVVSTFDSLNHLLTPADLSKAFRSAAESLEPGGLFVFDINTPAAYQSEWGKSAAIVDDDAAVFIRGSF